MTDPVQQKYPKPLSMLTLDHFFADMSSIALTTQEEALRCMSLFLQYTRLVHDSIAQPRPDCADLIRKIFVHGMSSDEHLLIRRGSYLHRWYVEETDATDEADLDVELAKFVQILCTFLGKRLWNRVQAQHRIISGLDGRHYVRDTYALQLFDPCPVAAQSSDGKCLRRNCSLVHTFDVPWFNRRLGVYLHQMMILDMAQTAYPSFYEFPTRMGISR